MIYFVGPGCTDIAKNDLQLLSLESPASASEVLGLKAFTHTLQTALELNLGFHACWASIQCLSIALWSLCSWYSVPFEHIITTCQAVHPLVTSKLLLGANEGATSCPEQIFLWMSVPFLLDRRRSTFWDRRQRYTHGRQLDSFPQCLHKLYL